MVGLERPGVPQVGNLDGKFFGGQVYLLDLLERDLVAEAGEVDQDIVEFQVAMNYLFVIHGLHARNDLFEYFLGDGLGQALVDVQ